MSCVLLKVHSFPLALLLENCLLLGTDTVYGEIFSSECITLFRETHESGIEEKTQLVAFLYYSPFYSEVWSHRYMTLVYHYKDRASYKLFSPAEQGLTPS